MSIQRGWFFLNRLFWQILLYAKCYVKQCSLKAKMSIQRGWIFNYFFYLGVVDSVKSKKHLKIYKQCSLKAKIYISVQRNEMFIEQVVLAKLIIGWMLCETVPTLDIEKKIECQYKEVEYLTIFFYLGVVDSVKPKKHLKIYRYTW